MDCYFINTNQHIIVGALKNNGSNDPLSHQGTCYWIVEQLGSPKRQHY